MRYSIRRGIRLGVRRGISHAKMLVIKHFRYFGTITHLAYIVLVVRFLVH